MSRPEENPDLTIEEMMDNMGEPSRTVSCPIRGCDYKNTPDSVAGHVSASSLDTHIWENTKYHGWKHFKEVHENKTQSSSSKDNESTKKSVTCPIRGCDYENTPASVARHVSGSSEDKHIWENTEYYGWEHFREEHGEPYEPNPSDNNSSKSATSCPIPGCNYTDSEAKSVTRHVIESSEDDHTWSNTEYKDWKHFLDSF